MRILGINRLRAGDFLGKSIYNENSELLLAAGFRMDNDIIALIKRHGFNYVHVIDQATESIVLEDVISDALRFGAQVTMVETFNTIRSNPAMISLDPANVETRLREDNRFGSMVKMRTIRRLISDMLEEILANGIKLFVSLPLKSAMGREYEHAVDTALLSILLAQEFEFSKKELIALGTAALLHDIGKLILVDNPDHSAETKKSFRDLMITEHPTYSRLILEGSEQYSYEEQLTVHQHHERVDGKGYPLGLRSINKPPSIRTTNKWAQIHKYALILMVANRYDNLLTGELDGQPLSPDQAITQMVDEAGSAWNAHVIKALGNVVIRYPVGCTVIIRNTTSKKYIDYVGVVSYNGGPEPGKPEIILTHNTLGATIKPTIIDLSTERDVEIELDI